MKKINGFTLIELLAVILILGILALITVPIINSVIDNSEKSSLEASVTLYGREIETKVKGYMASHRGAAPTGTYYSKKETDGKVLYNKTTDSELSDLTLEYNGNIVECDDIEIYDNGSVYVSSCKIDDKDVDKYYGVKMSSIGE